MVHIISAASREPDGRSIFGDATLMEPLRYRLCQTPLAAKVASCRIPLQTRELLVYSFLFFIPSVIHFRRLDFLVNLLPVEKPASNPTTY